MTPFGIDVSIFIFFKKKTDLPSEHTNGVPGSVDGGEAVAAPSHCQQNPGAMFLHFWKKKQIYLVNTPSEHTNPLTVNKIQVSLVLGFRV